MAGENPSESPLDTVADTLGERTTEAFETLANETRLAILLALWESESPGPPRPSKSESSTQFSELRERVGIRDSGQFNYHLDKLVGPFLESLDEGYQLTTAAKQVLGAVLSGTFSEHGSFEGKPIDATCGHCGGSVVIDYIDRVLIERCPKCEESGRASSEISGVIGKTDVPPVGLENTTPKEFHRKGRTWIRHRLFSMMEGVCPRCSGPVTARIHICEDHETGDGPLCERCGMGAKIQAFFVCDVCKKESFVPAHATIFTEQAVKAFYFERGLDYDALFDASETEKLVDPIRKTEVQSEEPIEVVVTVEIDGDRLEITLDEDTRVTDLQKDV